ncbi:glycosyltransferase [Microcella sp.]|uniref:glycosyltransferase n=1 Tax=Microcella sp. TaxID=1913979 RepID=UPI003919FDB1
MHSDPVCLIVTSRLRPGLDGGYTVATMRRAQLFAEAGHPVVLATVDLHPDYAPFAAEFRRLGLADTQTVMRNLLEEVRSRPAILRDAADPELEPTIDESAGTHREAFELDAAGVPWRQVVRDTSGAVVFTDFFDAEGIPLFRLPFVAAPDWWRTEAVIDVLTAGHTPTGGAGVVPSRVGGLAGFGALYRAWWRALVDDQRALHPDARLVAIAEARQVGEHWNGTGGVPLVHTVHNAHTTPPHDWDSPMDITWSGWLDTLPRYDAVVWLTERQRSEVARRRAGAEDGAPGDAPGYVIPHPAEPPADVLADPSVVAGADHRDLDRAVMVARLAPQKRLDHAIRAWRRVVDARPTARLDIYGDGPLRADLQALIDELRLGDAVTLHGHTPDAPEQSRTAALLLLTSVYEGQSLAITEAMARGCPAVSYNIAYGPGELITDGETGRLVPAGDIAALADAVLGMLGNATEIDRLSRASLEWALANGPDRARERWERLFADLAGRTPRALSS